MDEGRVCTLAPRFPGTHADCAGDVTDNAPQLSRLTPVTDGPP
jgi:hypothetical protein